MQINQLILIKRTIHHEDITLTVLAYQFYKTSITKYEIMINSNTAIMSDNNIPLSAILYNPDKNEQRSI